MSEQSHQHFLTLCKLDGSNKPVVAVSSLSLSDITLALSSSEPCLHVCRWAKANWQAVLHECCGAQVHTKGRALFLRSHALSPEAHGLYRLAPTALVDLKWIQVLGV